MTIQLGEQPQDFIWGSGIEDTFVPQTRPGHRALDEYQLIGHYQHWREDLALGRELGIQALRWGIPWYRVEPFPGEFDWRWTDQVIPYLVEELGITPIIDLMHYGCPFWLYREFDNRDYPARVANYAAAFAERYKHLVHWYTPLNEPQVNAMWCGYKGQWPPYLRGYSGYVRIMLQLARGIQQTVRALKSVDPSAIMVHVEATGISLACHPEANPHAALETARGYLCFDLLTGRVRPDHFLFSWLLENGATAEELAVIATQPIPIDVMGLNFYPQWSSKTIHLDNRGRVNYRIVDKTGKGFRGLVEQFYSRYKTPIMITETSARGTDEVRAAWLRDSLSAIKEMRQGDIPIHGYIWFPMFTMIDWKYRTGQKPLEDYQLDLGFYSLQQGKNTPRWQPTNLIQDWTRHVSNPADSIGEMPATGHSRESK